MDKLDLLRKKEGGTMPLQTHDKNIRTVACRLMIESLKDSNFKAQENSLSFIALFKIIPSQKIDKTPSAVKCRKPFGSVDAYHKGLFESKMLFLLIKYVFF